MDFETLFIPTIYCKMKRQDKVWSCGAAAVRNALRCFGVKISEGQIRSAAGTTKAFGTSEHGIMDSLRENGLTAIEHHFGEFEEAWTWLHGILLTGKKVILAVECWEHWVLALGSGGTDIVVFDSSNFKKNTYENGAHIWDKKKLKHMWYNSRKSVCDKTEKRIYAISVGKK